MSGQNLKAYIYMSLLSPSAQWRKWKRVLEHQENLALTPHSNLLDFWVSANTERNKLD